MKYEIKLYSSWEAIVTSNNCIINWGIDDVRFALLTDDYTPDPVAHVFWSDIKSYEVTGGGYTTLGNQLSDVNIDQVENDLSKIVAGNVSWEQDDNGFTNARYGVLYANRDPDTTSRLLGYIDFRRNASNLHHPLTIHWKDSAIFKYIIC